MSDDPSAREGALGKVTAPDAVILERVLPAAIERVWTYLTDPRYLSAWLAGGTIDLRAGGRVELDFAHFKCPGRESVQGTMSGVITELDPPHLLTYSWRESTTTGPGGPESLVSFRLRAIDDRQTHLILSHRLIRPQELPGIAAGWHVHLAVLVDRFTEREPAHFMSRWATLEREYRELHEWIGSGKEQPPV
ncbi:MAG TPA: SRPBCC family protein [Steroidobacteraceae bacterium]|nr:SRPBCC family protein [Steroidobacteraceae bacterium]